MLFFETGSPTKSLSTKTVILSTCFCLRNLSAALGFPTKYRAACFNETKSNSRSSLVLGPNASPIQQDPICNGPGMRGSCKQICIVLFHLSLESDSVFRLTPVCLVVSLMVCRKSGSISKYCPSFDQLQSEHTIQQHKAFHV